MSSARLIVSSIRCHATTNPAPNKSDSANAPAPTIGRFENLRAILALGTIAHQSVVRALGERVAAFKFGHGSRHEIGGITLFGSYHCSRYNTNTGRLTEEMFVDVFSMVRQALDS